MGTFLSNLNKPHFGLFTTNIGHLIVAMIITALSMVGYYFVNYLLRLKRLRRNSYAVQNALKSYPELCKLYLSV